MVSRPAAGCKAGTEGKFFDETSDPETICRLRAAGFRGFLIGETFMKTANPSETLKEFIQDSLLIDN